jgi:CBS domain-containing protein
VGKRLQLFAGVDDGGRLIGMITDRDICMCAYREGLPLPALTMSAAAAHRVISCSPGDSLSTAEKLMRDYKILGRGVSWVSRE